MLAEIADELISIVKEWSVRFQEIDHQIVRTKPAPDRWSVQEVVGHLIDSCANNHQRFIRAQFVDELLFPKYEQNEWVASQRFNDRDWFELIELWRLYNQHLAHVIRNVDQKQLDVPCTIQPGEPVTLQFLIEDYIEHLKHHLQMVKKRLPFS